jgi:origin recognition complex subunit 4
MSAFHESVAAKITNTPGKMARKEIDTPRSSKRRKLDQTEVPKSSPIPSKLARKRTSKEKELDLYDDIDGGLTKSEPRKRRGWKGWVEIDEDEDEEVAEEEEIVATPSKRQAKLKAKETLSSLAWMQNGKSKGMPKNTVMTDNWDREEEVQAVAYKGSGRSTVRKQGRTMSTSPEAFLEDLPDAESPTKTPSRRKRGVVQTKTTQEDEEMEHIGAAPKSTGRRRRTTEEEATVGTPSKSRKRPRRAVEEEEEEEEADEEQVVTRTPSKGQKQRRQQRQLDDTHDEPEAMDLDPIENEVETISSYKAVATNGKTVDQPPASDEITLIKSIVLSKLTQRRPVPLMNLDSEYAKVHQLLEATVTSGESNSMLLIGARGSGKTALINKALLELSRSQKEHFHIVRLNGFIQTDDKLALREIWRQLGREMEIEDDEGTTSKSYADTLAMLLALLSHPDEISGERGGQTAKSVLFIMDEFDLFATHPRQTLLYNLLDIAQSRKAPIAVLGLTTRIDVTEALEKRVKSRFSHRYVHLNLARTLGEFVDAAKAALKILPEELGFEEKTVLVNSAVVGTKKGQKGDVLECWNRAIDVSVVCSSLSSLHI